MIQIAQCIQHNHLLKLLNKHSNSDFHTGFGTAAGSLLIITGLVFFIHKASLIKNRKKPTHTSSMLPKDLEKGYAHSGIKTFTYDELVQATHNFDTKREIGDGGFCTVYQGKY